MKQFMGKYASGNRRAAGQRKAQADFVKSLPLAIRKAIKARDEACGKFSMAVSDGMDRDTVLALGRAYHELRDQVNAMITEYNGGAK